MKFIKTIPTKEDDLYVVWELFEGINLEKYIKKQQKELLEYKLKGEYIYMLKFKQYELNCLKILFKCLKGLNFLDKSGLCHRDLSANNIMVIEDDI